MNPGFLLHSPLSAQEGQDKAYSFESLQLPILPETMEILVLKTSRVSATACYLHTLQDFLQKFCMNPGFVLHSPLIAHPGHCKAYSFESLQLPPLPETMEILVLKTGRVSVRI